jgi:hypothetical protein
LELLFVVFRYHCVGTRVGEPDRGESRREGAGSGATNGVDEGAEEGEEVGRGDGAAVTSTTSQPCNAAEYTSAPSSRSTYTMTGGLFSQGKAEEPMYEI